MMNNLKNTTAIKRIAIVATDNKRADLIEWSYFNKDLLTKHPLTAVGETGLVLEGTLNITVNKLFTADTGGYQQLAGLIENGGIDMLFFFADPDSSVEKDLDLKNLLVVAAKHNVIVASNKVTTEMVMASEFSAKEHIAKRKSSHSLFKQTMLFFSQHMIKPTMPAI
ncbi:MAG: methylglyoxal synthase [Chitinophagaceae bacterium]